MTKNELRKIERRDAGAWTQVRVKFGLSRHGHIGGHYVVAVEPTSMVVDHRLVDAYIKERWPGTIKIDPMNFWARLPGDE